MKFLALLLIISVLGCGNHENFCGAVTNYSPLLLPRIAASEGRKNCRWADTHGVTYRGQ